MRATARCSAFQARDADRRDELRHLHGQSPQQPEQRIDHSLRQRRRQGQQRQPVEQRINLTITTVAGDYNDDGTSDPALFRRVNAGLATWFIRGSRPAPAPTSARGRSTSRSRATSTATARPTWPSTDRAPRPGTSARSSAASRPSRSASRTLTSPSSATSSGRADRPSPSTGRRPASGSSTAMPGTPGLRRGSGRCPGPGELRSPRLRSARLLPAEHRPVLHRRRGRPGHDRRPERRAGPRRLRQHRDGSA